jgi:hypothetical protein
MIPPRNVSKKTSSRGTLAIDVPSTGGGPVGASGGSDPVGTVAGPDGMDTVGAKDEGRDSSEAGVGEAAGSPASWEQASASTSTAENRAVTRGS